MQALAHGMATECQGREYGQQSTELGRVTEPKTPRYAIRDFIQKRLFPAASLLGPPILDTIGTAIRVERLRVWLS